ncbi:winged helix-turn-helix domain-containing protein [Herbidospora mongoliensis]|uniref:winged helix-turn-helix domain-containing protein n=1 Tax=Herbidospora mongoliensis TaxID=688067 RepID=UPI0008331FAD|nr:winged helix-turn-helix domain-containing protein [Herbidospora mongoliensis]
MVREIPKYEQIANDLRQRITSGEFPPGSKLPSISDLESSYGASMGTVERALEILRGKRLIRTHQGIGSLVQGGTEKSEHVLDLPDGKQLTVTAYDTGAIRIRINHAPYVLSDISLKGGADDSITVELSPGGQGSAAYTGRV